MITSLDPHSRYMNEKAWRDMQETTSGEFGGLGIEVTMEDGLVKVVAPMDDTPAAKAGVMSGDLITHINGEAVQGLTLEQAVNKMKGPINTKTRLKIVRKVTEAPIEVSIMREVIHVRPVRYHTEGGDIGYVRITTFNEQTTDALKKAIADISRQIPPGKLAGYVVDLRNNPGGLLDQAVKVCKKFLPRNQLVVSTEGRDEKQKSEYRATGRDRHPSMPIVLLVNYGSASASEIVAGCLQDATGLGVCKAIVVGEQTFGKGSVQSILPLQDGSALRLTTAKYYTPSHKVIHEKGITPDIIVPMSDEEEHDVFLKRTPGALETLDLKEQERVRNAHDVQLDRAMDLLKGISLYSKRAPAQERRVAKGEKVADVRR